MAQRKELEITSPLEAEVQVRSECIPGQACVEDQVLEGSPGQPDHRPPADLRLHKPGVTTRHRRRQSDPDRSAHRSFGF